MTEPPGKANIEAILAFLPVLESKGFAFGEVVAQPGQFGHARIAPEVDGLVRALYDNGWVEPFDWSKFQDEAIGYFENPLRLETVDLKTINRYSPCTSAWTASVRATSWRCSRRGTSRPSCGGWLR